MELKELIELILGMFVVVAVIVAISVFFGGQIISFFKGLSVGKPAGVFFALIK